MSTVNSPSFLTPYCMAAREMAPGFALVAGHSAALVAAYASGALRVVGKAPTPVKIGAVTLHGAASSSAVILSVARALALSASTAVAMGTLSFTAVFLSTCALRTLKLIKGKQEIDALIILSVAIPTALKIANFANSWWTVAFLVSGNIAGIINGQMLLEHLEMQARSTN